MSEQENPNVDPMAPVSVPRAGSRDGSDESTSDASNRAKTNLAFQRRYVASKRKRMTAGPMFAIVGLLVLVIVAVFATQSGRIFSKPIGDQDVVHNPLQPKLSRAKGRPDQIESVEKSNNEPPAQPKIATTENSDADLDGETQTKPNVTQEPSIEPSSDSSSPRNETSKPKPVRLTDDELRELGETLKRAKQAIVDRKNLVAAKQLEKAKSLAKSEAHITMVERLAALAGYVQEFWKTVDESLSDIEGAELVYNGKLIYVVSCNANKLVLRIQGRNRDYPRDRLPPKLVMLIADRWFNQDAASTKVFKGAFMAVSLNSARRKPSNYGNKPNTKARTLAT